MYKPQNPINQIAEYILKNLKKGYPLDALKISLSNQGYSKISIENAIKLVNEKIADSIPPIKEKPQITYKILDEKEKPIKIQKIKKKRSIFKRIFK